ncbi:hypothetical protein ABW19_dt0210356 [Dactylella cylindrospora]|nr:hypothetical protein ABW19_dt0210356 [Dactylella cylindrospora]
MDAQKSQLFHRDRTTQSGGGELEKGDTKNTTINALLYPPRADSLRGYYKTKRSKKSLDIPRDDPISHPDVISKREALFWSLSTVLAVILGLNAISIFFLPNLDNALPPYLSLTYLFYHTRFGDVVSDPNSNLDLSLSGLTTRPVDQEIPSISTDRATTPLCDLYAVKLFGYSTPSTQLSLVKTVIDVAFLGNFSGLTKPVNMGILRPGSYAGKPVDLVPYFNGEYVSSNRGGKAVNVNLLDGRGIMGFTHRVSFDAKDRINARSEQGRFRRNIESYFAEMLGCSGYGKSRYLKKYAGRSMDEVHKFMNLGEKEIGYFIRQMELAMEFLDFDAEDSRTVGKVLKMSINPGCDEAGSKTKCKKPPRAKKGLGMPGNKVAREIEGVRHEYLGLGRRQEDFDSAFPFPTTSPDFGPTPTASDSFATTIDQPPPTDTSTPPTDDNNSNVLPAAIGGGVGGGVGVVLIAAVAFYFYRRRQKSKAVGVMPAPPEATIQYGPTDMSRVGYDGQQIGGIQEDLHGYGGISPPPPVVQGPPRQQF